MQFGPRVNQEQFGPRVSQEQFGPRVNQEQSGPSVIQEQFGPCDPGVVRTEGQSGSQCFRREIAARFPDQEDEFGNWYLVFRDGNEPYGLVCFVLFCGLVCFVGGRGGGGGGEEGVGGGG